jgi:hypothetical protein
MNWEAVGAVAEILGSLAVIGTIFYLAVQVGHAAAIAKATTQQSTAQMSIDAMALTLDSQILSSASRKATIGEELTPEELSNLPTLGLGKNACHWECLLSIPAGTSRIRSLARMSTLF